MRRAGCGPSFAAVSSRFCARLVIVDLTSPRVGPATYPARSVIYRTTCLRCGQTAGSGRRRGDRHVADRTILDMFRLDGRVAIVTGASSGLGVVFARALAEAGADVALGARRAQRPAGTPPGGGEGGRRPHPPRPPGPPPAG